MSRFNLLGVAARKLSVSSSRSRSTRSRRPAAVVETLEVRALMTSAAVVQWKMVPQIGPDPSRGGTIDLPNTPAYVNPVGGYQVALDASKSSGITPKTTFLWAISGNGQPTGYTTGEDPIVRLPQGPYTVTLEAKGLKGQRNPVYVTTMVTVKDVLIVAIGDSIASGEGNPVVPARYPWSTPQWAYSPDPNMNLENANAHRSTLAGPAQFALKLQQANPHEAVTFVSVANSGATIEQGLLGPMQSIGDSNYTLPAEVQEVKQIVGSHPIDALTISIGANDVGFKSSLENLISNTLIGYPSLSSIKAFLSSIDTTFVSKANVQFAVTNIYNPLNAAVQAAATAEGWTYVGGIAAAFKTHGYPSSSSWIRTITDSLLMQHNISGSFHPTAAGQQAIAGLLLSAYEGTTPPTIGSPAPKGHGHSHDHDHK